jgi:hypothetical protein
MSESKFKVGDKILWDRNIWIVVNVNSELYELELANKNVWTRHGKQGYMDIETIDASATKVEQNAGSKRSRKNRRSRNRSRVYRKYY